MRTRPGLHPQRDAATSPYAAIPVLVVDDNMTMVSIVRRLLWRIGFRIVDDATNGLDALVKMSERKYGLVLADWHMEPMSGYELLKQVRGDPQFAKLLTILMTANPKPEQVVAAKNAGASYISKPFSAQRLKEKIDALFLASDLQPRHSPL